jgi:hypothetical protein
MFPGAAARIAGNQLLLASVEFCHERLRRLLLFGGGAVRILQQHGRGRPQDFQKQFAVSVGQGLLHGFHAVRALQSPMLVTAFFGA